MDEDDFRALEALYEGELSYLDYRLGQLFEFLRSKDILDETLVFVVGDHGENIGDHGLMDHQYCLNDTLLRVPLVVRHSELVPSGWKTDTLVELRDLSPTILDLCDVNVPLDESVSSFSLSEDGYIDETTIGDREFVFAGYTVPQPDLDELRSRTDDEEALAFLDSLDQSLRYLRIRDWKYIRSHDGSVELFDLNSDPSETNNIAENHSELVTDFEERLDTKFDSVIRSTGARLKYIGDGTRDRLEDLGYI